MRKQITDPLHELRRQARQGPPPPPVRGTHGKAYALSRSLGIAIVAGITVWLLISGLFAVVALLGVVFGLVAWIAGVPWIVAVAAAVCVFIVVYRAEGGI